MNKQALLSVNDLCVAMADFSSNSPASDRDFLPIVRGISFELFKGECLAIVGESGCGKSMAMLAIMGLLPRLGSAVQGSVRFKSQELIGQTDQQMNRLRGSRIAMIFQDPMSSLNPTMCIGDQIAEPLIVHKRMPLRQARRKAVQLLEETGIDQPEQRIHQYPFEFSGGMLQRVMIAMALACEPDLIIADEPSTALDVTTQQQVLGLLKSLQKKRGMALLLITHDLGVVSDMADRVAVMYAGEFVEQGSLEDVFSRSAHPYTQALKRSTPALQQVGKTLAVLEGMPPAVGRKLQGCPFATRCQQAMRVCVKRSVPNFSLSSESSPPILLSQDDINREHCVRCALYYPQLVAVGVRASGANGGQGDQQ